MTPRIPFNHPTLIGNEAAYVAQALASGHISGDGAFTKRCHALLERTLGASRVLLTSSCTHALEMAALLLDLQPGDEVIVPSFTFVSTVNAFVLRGARPVFVDIRSDTLNLDERQLERALSSRTRAIVVVHYAGIACEMDTISALAARHGIPIVEDNAHGLFGRYRGRWLGTLGSLATLSFHETKNYTCGEGGALVVNDPHLVARAEVLREKGTNRSRFFRGEVDKYTWVDLGSSYLPSDLSAAMLLGQLEEQDHVQARRKELFDRYMEGLWDWAHTSGVGLPQIPPECTPAYHLFYVRLPDEAMRSRFIRWLDSQGVHSVFHYVPLHTSPMGRRYGYAAGDLPMTEAVSDQLARLPFFFGLSRAQQDRVIRAAVSFPMNAA
ncbi:MAG: dTDP-4-amino-4,6-dideoxygalactose transaminase [candidate division NC10 bacterium]|nr:dTDP-4-amino-4,6-dideoxygalactose transaminase [candidate division NC10 bacterium]